MPLLKKKLFVFFVIVFSLICLFSFIKIEILDHRFINADKPSPLLNKRTRLTQKIKLDGYLSKLSIQFGTYSNKLSGQIEIIISKDEFKKKITFQASAIENNLFTAIPININFAKGVYKFNFFYVSKNKEEKISIWLSKKQNSREEALIINGQNHYRTILFRKYYKVNFFEGVKLFLKRYSIFNKTIIFVIITLYLLISMLVFYLHKKKRTK